MKYKANLLIIISTLLSLKPLVSYSGLSDEEGNSSLQEVSKKPSNKNTKTPNSILAESSSSKAIENKLEELSITQKEEQLGLFIKQNFSGKNCITKPEQFSEIDKKFNRILREYKDHTEWSNTLKELFSCYTNRKAIQASLYLQTPDRTTYKKGIGIYMPIILFSEPYIDEGIVPLLNYRQNFMTEILKIITINSGKSIEDIMGPLFAIKDLYKNLVPTNKANYSSLIVSGLDSYMHVFAFLLIFDIQVHDTFLDVQRAYLKAIGAEEVFNRLIKRLYLTYKDNSSPFVKEYYALLHLIPEKRYAEALNIYNTLLKNIEYYQDDNYRTSLLFMSTGFLFAKLENNQECLNYYKKASTLYNRPIIFSNIGSVHIALKNYNEAAFYFEQTLKMPNDQVLQDELDFKVIKRNYLYSLKMSGDEEKFNKTLLNDHKNSLEINQKLKNSKKLKSQEKYIAAIKFYLDQVKQEKEKKDAEESLKQFSIKESTEKSKNKEIEVEKNDYSFGINNNVSEKYIKPGIKEKKKTRRLSEKKSVSFKDSYIEKAVTIEDLLNPNSHAYEIFCRFFKKYDDALTDQNVKISLKQLETLMTALGQEYSDAKGKGSHHKATLNFQSAGIDIEEKVLIFTNHIYLSPYQIKQMREAFLDYGLYPKDLIRELEKKGLL